MKRVKWKAGDDRGELMLESMIVYLPTMLLLFFILAVFSVLLQRWNLQTIANEAAMRMAQTYRLTTADESTGYVTDEQLEEVGLYRYIFNGSKTDMMESVQERITTYAGWRMSRTTYTKNVVEPQFDVEVTSDALGRRHLEVVITGEYQVPFGEALAFFGFGGTTQYEVTAYADCVDLIDYVHFIDYVEYQTNVNRLNPKVVGMIDSLIGLYNTIFNKDEP